MPQKKGIDDDEAGSREKVPLKEIKEDVPREMGEEEDPEDDDEEDPDDKVQSRAVLSLASTEMHNARPV